MKRVGERRAFFLCAVLAAQLILAPVSGGGVRAAGVTPDPNAAAGKRPSVDAAPNGVPVVNITAANGSGLSHNQYHDFNVRQQGLILNNGSAASNTQLGGIVAGNPNFRGNRGAEARAILNEVTSANRSRIEGYIEVGGRAADVILANPNGVTINGGGFINVPRATVTTGRPEVDATGALRGYEVRGGEIVVEGAGINADNTDAFTLLARTARVEAQVRAKNLAVVTGRNRVGVDGAVTPLADDPGAPAAEKPEVAIDASALGGMYAGRIFLIATEKGVGVNLEGTVQSADQMVITADGKLRLREAASGGDATLVSKGEIELTGASVTAARDLSVKADKLRLEKGVFEPQYEARKAKKQAAGGPGAKAASGAGSAADPAARTRTSEPLKASLLYAGDNLSIRADTLHLGEGSQTASGVDSSGRLTKKGSTSIAVNTLEAQQARLLSGGSMGIAAAAAEIKASTLAAADDVTLTGRELSLVGGVLQGGRVGLNVEHAALTGKARAEAATDLAFRAALAELNDASLSAGRDLVLDLGTALLEAQSSLASGNDLSLRATDLTLEGAFVAAGRDLAYTGANLANLGGVLYASRDQHLSASGLLLNDGGDIYAGRHILMDSADGLRANIVRNLSGVIAAAGGMLSIEAATVENAKRDFEITRRAERVSYDVKRECRPYADCDHRQWLYYTTVDDDVIARDSPLAQILAADDINIAANLVENKYSTIAAGKNLNITAQTLNNVEARVQRTREVVRTMQGWDGDDDYTGEFYEGTDYYYTDLQLVPALLSANGVLGADVGDTLNNLSERQGIALPGDPSVALQYPLSGSPMFRPSAAPGHHYLIETNPMFTKMGNFYGSDYFLSRIGLDQKRQQVVLLGDAFYETRLVQQQILAATGRRFLDGYSTDADQMRGLMDNAVAQAQALNLSAGVALSPDQVAALTRDIIWLVEEEHLGEKVLVPHIYLASASQEDTQPKSGLRGREVYLHAGQAIANQGAISGGAVNLASLNIRSTGGLLSGGTLNLVARNDIYNKSGVIQGREVNLSAGGDIVSQTLTATHGGRTQVLTQAAVQADGNLTLNAGRDVALKGSALVAGGDAALVAGRDLLVGAVTDETHFDVGKVWEHSVTHTGSSVAVDGNLQMTAANDLTVAGSGVASGGDATLAAGRNLTVTAVQDQYNVHAEVTSNKGGLFGSGSKSSTDISRTTSKGASIAAGGNLTLVAGAAASGSGQQGHASVVGSNLLGGKDLTVAASGNVNVASAQDSSYYNHSKSTVGTLGLSSSSKQQGNASVSQVGSTLMGQNVTLDAGKSVSVTASGLAAAGNLSLTARDGDVAVVDRANRSTSWYSKKQTGFGLGGAGSFTSFYGTEGKKEASASGRSQGSLLAAGQDISLTASRDAAIVGSSLSAGRDVTISAGRDANILGGVNTSSYSKETFAAGFGVEGLLGLDKSSAFVGYQQLATGQDKAATRNAASQITADNNLTVKAGRNVNISGSKLAAAQDLNMAAGQDINLLQATNTDAASAYEQKLRAGLSLTLTQNLTTNAQNLYTNVKGMTAVSSLGGGVSGAGKIIDSGESLLGSKAQAGLSLGVSSSWNNSQSHSATAVPDELSAGRDMALAAGQDLNMQGAQAQAGRDMTLAAGRDLTIRAAQSTAGSQRGGGSFTAGLGVEASAGTSGYSLGLSGKLGLGGNQAQSDALKYSNAKLAANEKLTTVSGRDTTVAGANLTAKDVDMTVGRDLTVASLQDSSSASSSSYSVGGGYTKGKQTNWLGDSNPALSQAGALVSAGTGLAGSKGFDASTGMITAGATAATDMKTPPKSRPFENYNAGVSGQVAEGHSNTVGEQTSILGSESVNIYTEGNTHVAGAIIAALNDNLKLDTGTLSYENLVGKTTSSSTGAGINWAYSPAQNNSKKGESSEAQGGGSTVNKVNSHSSQGGQSVGQPTESGQKDQLDDKYKNLPKWMASIFKTSDSAQDWWKGKKENFYGVAPGKFAHTEKETTQTAYATIGKGEIIVRNNPGQSLDGLNRDPSQAMKTEQTKDVNIELKPAFSYVNDALSGWGWPANITGVFNFFADPKVFLNELQDNLAKSIPFLKRPTPRVNPVTPATNTRISQPSTSRTQGAVQE